MTSAESFAIVGIACRFPGADSPAALWRLLCDGVDAIREIPAERFDVNRVFSRDAAAPGRMNTRRGGFIDHVDRFDAGFFGMSPREAKHIDPQQRLLLELAWEAMEDAGIGADALAGTATGVFVGISTHDYGDVQTYPGHRHLIGSHTNSGTATSLAANRISHAFDFRGPSLIVDTACSSSLTAVHLACQSLRSGECEVALVGGVQLQLTPEPTIGFAKASMLSPDGQCRAFDAGANGYVRSEGGGVVLLRPLSAAIANRDPIYAVIRGTAINQDGHTNGMTVPSAAAQEAMLRTALTRAGLDAGHIDYVEAHGTGTPVGDPIEAAALGAVFSEALPAGRSCPIGSVKTNIGHLEAASGMAGLIKTALAIRHRALPASLHFEAPNPAIDFHSLRLRVVTALEPWPETGRPATAGVNGFGFGGANAHAILQEYRQENGAALAPARDRDERVEALVLSAKSPAACRSLARRYLDLLNRDTPLRDLCASAALTRTHLPHRVSIVGTRADVLDGLDAFDMAERRAGLASAIVPAGGPPPLAFVFSGMGPQWWAMGRQLLRDEPVFRDTIERCAAALPREAGWSLMAEFEADEAVSRLSEPDLAQVTGFALQAALAEWLRSIGIVPGAVLGHSAGEMAAAFVSGSLTLEACVELAWHRSRLQARGRPGKMIAVAVSEAAALRLIDESGGRLSLGAANSPTSVTLSGDTAAILALHERLQRDQVFSRIIPFPIAYHSAHMDVIERDLLDALAALRPVDGAIPIVSSVTGDWIDGHDLGAGYWWRNVREPVRFADAMVSLASSGYGTFLEIGPHPVLATSMSESLAAAGLKGTVLPTLRRNENERTMMLSAAGGLHVEGYPVDWAAVFRGGWNRVTLPSYPWERERHWFEAAPDSSIDAEDATAGAHPLLGRRLETATPTWEGATAHEGVRYLDDHLVQGTVVFPGVGYLEMAAAATAQLRPGPAVVLRDVSFVSPLFGAAGQRRRTQIAVDRDGRFEVQSRSEAGQWTLHAHGQTAAGAASAVAAIDLPAIRAACTGHVPSAAYYAQLEARGLIYGPAFRGIQDIAIGRDEAIARIALAGTLTSADGYLCHPTLFDAALQVLIGAASSGDTGSGSRLFLPVGVEEVDYREAVTGELWSHARVIARDPHHITGDVTIARDDGAVLISVRGLRCQIVEDGAVAASESIDDWLYEDRWEPAAPIGEAAATTRAGVDAARLRQEADVLADTSGWPRYYGEIEPALDRVARAYIVCAFEELGLRLSAGDAIAISSIDQLIPPARRPFADRLLSILETSGALQRHPDGYVVAEEARLEREPAALSRECRAAWPDYRIHLDLIDRCGQSLAGNLSGARTAQEVLFADEGFALIDAFYREAPASAFYNTLAARVVSSIVGQADDQPVRILEIGAGTGGTTAAVLPLLTRAPEAYVFSDVSRRFLDAAKTRFASVPFVSTTTFDLETGDHRELRGRFDVVLAANVVHAMPALADALQRIKTLLKPGGFLVLLEITVQPAWLDVVFGLTDAWWQFRDRDIRPAHALMDSKRWEALLEHAGFESVESVSDSRHTGEAAQSVIVAQAPRIEAGLTGAGRWLIVSDERGVARRVSERLTRAGAGCTVIGRGDRFDLDAADRQSIQGVIHLAALDVPPACTAGDLLASQQIGCGSALAAIQALAGIPRRFGTWLVTAGAQTVSPDSSALGQSSLWGLGRVVMREHPELRCRLIDIAPACDDEAVDALVREVLNGGEEEEIAFRDGVRCVRRLRRVQPGGARATETRPSRAGEEWHTHVGTPGALQTLEFRPRDSGAPAVEEVTVRIAAASINFRDVMLAMGTIPGLEQETTFGSRQLGLDAAGTIVSCGSGVRRFAPGDEVMGIVPGAFGSSGITSQSLLTRKPVQLDFEQAAGVPCVFVTAHYALNHLARLQPGERVLIHSAAGGVGQAAIQLARNAGAEIFATAGSAEKRAYLESLGVDHVMDSRSLEFAGRIMQITAGEGVDVVLNSLAGAALTASLSVLRPFGRFLEIGKRDIYQDAKLGLLPFRKNLSLHAIDLDRMCVERPDLVEVLLDEVADQFDRGRLRPLPSRTWPIVELEEAMRFMVQARHTGKILVSIAGSEVQVQSSREPAARFKPDATYVITGGLGGFGLAAAERMASGGAGALLLVGRQPPGAQVEERLARLREGGTRIEVMQGDVSIAADVGRLLDRVRREMPPLRGVVHAAMVLDDQPLDQMEWSRFERVLTPKMAGAWNLHTQTAADTLDFFVLFSSIAALFGNPMQASYAAANAYLDALAEYRRASGRHSLSIAWGLLSEVGYVASRPELFDYIVRQGYRAFSAAQALDVFEAALDQRRGAVVAARIDWAAWSAAVPFTAASPHFRQFSLEVAESRAGGGARETRTIVDLSDPETRRQRVDEYLRQAISRVLGTSPGRIQPDTPLTECGLDSLIAVELMTTLRMDLGLEIPVVKLLQGMTLNSLAAIAIEQHYAVPAPAPSKAPPAQEAEAAIEPPAPTITAMADPASGALPPPPIPADAPATSGNMSTAEITAATASRAATAERRRSAGDADHLERPQWSATQRIARFGITAVLRAATRLTVEGIDRVPPRGAAILAVNHLSMMDVPLAFAILQRPAIMLAKDDLRRWRIVDWLLSDVGRTIYVKRGEGDADALDRALAVLRAGGMVALGPEGRRSAGGLSQGRTGVGYLAAQSGAPVVPMAAWGQERLGQSWRRLRRAPIHVRFGSPLVFAAAGSGQDLRDYTDAVMRAIAAALPAEYRGMYGEP